MFNTAKQLYTAVQSFDAETFDEHPSWAERIIIAVAVALAVVIVGAVGVLVGVA